MRTRLLAGHIAAVAASGAWAWLWFSGRVPDDPWATLLVWSPLVVAGGLLLWGLWRASGRALAGAAWGLWLVSFPLIFGGLGVVTVAMAALVLAVERWWGKANPGGELARSLGTAALAALGASLVGAGWELVTRGAPGGWQLLVLLVPGLGVLAAAAWWPMPAGEHDQPA